MTRLGPNHIKLDILYNRINQLIPKPEIETDNNIPYMWVIFGILLLFGILYKSRIEIIDVWVDYSEQEENYHANEMKELPRYKAILVRFISKQYPIPIMEIRLPFDLDLLKSSIDVKSNEISELDDRVFKSDEFNDALFARRDLLTPDIVEPTLMYVFHKHQLLMDLFESSSKKICLLRKMESVYLLYVPTYKRKPLFLNEHDRIRVHQTPIVRH